ncbi:hypothetical protein MmiEs2_15600 [Methanimicrococcus stummii]|uniref:Uncharacterized protein n=1 Tax=Methanimicrococcus stummii TaxID=3028294 RepID=A0AA97A8P9_9EURY|nr:hypothetical protein MmiEs2_15600 [Methanimicrococcus sp. Es2]
MQNVKIEKLLFFLIIFLFLFTIINVTNASEFSGDGVGTVDEPYKIMTIHQLDEVRYNLSASYILMNDLDFNDTSNESWIPIGYCHDLYG